MVDLSQHPLPSGGTEAEILLAVLDRNRRTFAWKVFGPDADGGLERLHAVPADEGETHSLRRTIVDLIEEYARHTGHADLIRESVDGLVGEDAPAGG